jgi:hypothetical protein
MKAFLMISIILLSPKLWSSELHFDNVDDQIRAEEDPHFADALLEQQRHLDEERKFAEQQSEMRAKEEAQEEKNRLTYIEQRDRQIEIDRKERLKDYRSFLQNKQKERAQRLQDEESYLNSQAVQKEKVATQQIEQVALIQSKLSRMPASTLEALEHRPLADRKKRKFK